MVDFVVAPVMFGFILLLLSGHSTISACLAGLLGYAVLLWSCVEGTLLTTGDAYVSLSWFSLVVILSFLVRVEYFSEQRKLEMARGELDLYPSEQMNLISFNKRRIEDKFQQKVILHNFSFRLIQAGTSDLAGLNYYYEQTHSGAPIFFHSLIHRAITFCWANKQEYALGFIQANFTEEDNQKYGIMVHNRSFFIPTQG